MAPAWYVARTRPMSEYVAAAHLDSKGFDYYLPVVSTLSPRRGHHDAPLFPGYLFVRQDPESPSITLLRTSPGLLGLVAFGGIAPTVPDRVVDALRQHVAEVERKGALRQRFLPGDAVWVRWGNREAEDLAEVIQDARSPHGRVRVLLTFLGRLARAEVSRGRVRLAPVDEAERPGIGLSRRRTRGKGRYLTMSRQTADVRKLE